MSKIICFGACELTKDTNSTFKFVEKDAIDLFSGKLSNLYTKSGSTTSAKMDSNDENENMYSFEGTDFKKEDLELVQKWSDEESVDGLGDKRKRNTSPGSERRVKVEEDAEKAVKKEERKIRRMEEKNKMWEESGYKSCSLPDEIVQALQNLDLFSNNTPICDENLCFMSGNVAEPALVVGRRDIIIHVVDNSGTWCDRGVFKAIDTKFPQVKEVRCLIYLKNK